MTCTEYRAAMRVWDNDKVTADETAKSEEHYSSCPGCKVWLDARFAKDMKGLKRLADIALRGLEKHTRR